MTLAQLAYFLAAVEQGTFTKAAEALGVTQPSPTEQIVKLEATLGTGLFIRTNRKLMLILRAGWSTSGEGRCSRCK